MSTQSRSTQSRATLADVARLAGVSSKTVSRVFADAGNVSADTRERVLGSAKRLRFRPNNLARNLRRGGVTNTVAFVIGDLTNPFYFTVAAGIERELALHGLTMVLASTDDSPDSEERVVDALISQRVRALLLIPIADDQSYLDGERQLGTPVVSVDRPARNLIADSVVLQNRLGMADAVRSLTAIGHRKIGFISNPAGIYTQRERLAGYREALREVGVTQTAQWERLDDDPSVSAEHSVRSLLDQADPPTAIVAGNNRGSAGAVRVLRELDPPVAFIGFDDFELADALGITVVAYDPIELGRTAARLALGHLADPDSFTTQVEIPTRLIQRGSGEIAPPA
ncbi:LacI family DNA-binding transcriptional regulator [Cryobacterium sp. SO2]|uniref:LacI family DNA-binding transcriptional regulator n=1 Tax=Cryobacterium sp. SO2 TaxID=1897060 RepID=UPI00223DE817|nr:LacI family DNA-binding transcriptional regulator [Cryobacterium sp. SO2]WEO78957.1 LacI family DNA-binding transcriptional regulator [Cryobacterium sp. SO2]